MTATVENRRSAGGGLVQRQKDRRSCSEFARRRLPQAQLRRPRFSPLVCSRREPILPGHHRACAAGLARTPSIPICAFWRIDTGMPSE
jgi:hypothetical protein